MVVVSTPALPPGTAALDAQTELMQAAVVRLR
jgi:hypothetical protein